MNITVIYDTNVLIRKYEMTPGYVEVFSIIKHNDDMFLLVCSGIRKEYIDTLSRVMHHSVHRALIGELEMLGENVISRSNEKEADYKIVDTADQKFVDCAFDVNIPTVIVSSNIDDYQEKNATKNSKGNLELLEIDEYNIVIIPELWIDEKKREATIINFKDTINRSRKIKYKSKVK